MQINVYKRDLINLLMGLQHETEILFLSDEIDEGYFDRLKEMSKLYEEGLIRITSYGFELDTTLLERMTSEEMWELYLLLK